MFKLFQAPPKLIPAPNFWWDPMVFKSMGFLSTIDLYTWTDTLGGVLLNATGTSSNQYSRTLINGQAGIQFAGGYAENLSNPAPASFLTGTNVAFSVTAVGYTTNLSAYQYLWSAGNTTSNNPILGVRFSNTGKFQFIKQDNSGALAQPVGGTVASGTPYIITMTTDGSILNLRVNGTIVIPNHAVGANAITFDNFVIGAHSHNGVLSNNLVGGIGSVAFWEFTLTTPQIINVERFFANRYGITLP